MEIMNQNAKAFIWQFTYTICLKSAKASENNAVPWEVHRLLGLATLAASFPAPQLFPPKTQGVLCEATDILNYFHFLRPTGEELREN